MKIYDYHASPEKLLGHSNRHNTLPYILDELASVDDNITDEQKARFKKVEHIIASVPKASYLYALHIKHRFHLGERSFMKDPLYAVFYVEDILQKRDVTLEKIILTDPFAASAYAGRFLESRWIAAEPIIAKDKEAAAEYNEIFGTNL